jgi:predicted RNase H-like nuclease (RuvC/YqgF family)
MESELGKRADENRTLMKQLEQAICELSGAAVAKEKEEKDKENKILALEQDLRAKAEEVSSQSSVVGSQADQIGRIQQELLEMEQKLLVAEREKEDLRQICEEELEKTKQVSDSDSSISFRLSFL